MSDGSLAPGQFGVGSRVACYRLEEPLGRGGMAVVYRAYDTRLERRVALKILAPELARDESFRKRFIRESRAAAAVDHPNIIPIFEAGEADGVLFIAMRFVGGRDVRTLIGEHGKLPVARSCDIVAQVASALDAAHAHGLVHRDVKPANMLRDAAAGSGNADHVYLADFGLSKHSLSSSGLTSQGEFLGTLDYVAPEQIEGRVLDGRADQYALACSAFEMLTGTPPFQHDETLATMWAQLSAAPPALTSRRPDLPAAVDEVMAKALAKAADDRYGTCLDFTAALRRAMNPEPATAIPGMAEPARDGIRAARPPDPAAAGAAAAGAQGLPAAAGTAGRPLMPGTGVARRPLHVIVMADCSGSMKGEKIQALNYAIRSVLPHLASWELGQVQAQLLIRILKFATVPEWHVHDPTPVAELSAGWQDLEYVHQGRTNMGAAFRAVAEVLRPGTLERRALRPAILLITDGQPTDPPGRFETGLAGLTGFAAGRSTLRVAVAIGREANSEPLNRFRSPDVPVLVADSTDEIVHQLVVASIAVSRMSEAGAFRGAITETLLRP